MVYLATKWTRSLNQHRVLVQSYLQKVSEQGVRTHPPMVLSVMVREINQLAFYQVQQAYLPPCVKVHIYSDRSSTSLFNSGETFWLVMMPLGGGKTIITLWAADRDRGRRRGCQRSWEVTCHHSCPFALQVAERGSWQAVGMTCKTCLLQSTIRTNISGQDMLVVQM